MLLLNSAQFSVTIDWSCVDDLERFWVTLPGLKAAFKDKKQFSVSKEQHCQPSETWTVAAMRRYLLGDGESDDGIALQDLPCHHGRVDFNLSDGHIEWSWQQGVWQRCTAKNEHSAYKYCTFPQNITPSCFHILIPHSPLLLFFMVSVKPVLINPKLSQGFSWGELLWILSALHLPIFAYSSRLVLPRTPH